MPPDEIIDTSEFNFDSAGGYVASLVGQEQALAGASEAVKEGLLDAIAFTARTRRFFSSDHIWRHYFNDGGQPVSNPRVLGPLLTAATKSGTCVRRGTAKSQRRERHRGTVSWYESRLCEPDGTSLPEGLSDTAPRRSRVVLPAKLEALYESDEFRGVLRDVYSSKNAPDNVERLLNLIERAR